MQTTTIKKPMLTPEMKKEIEALKSRPIDLTANEDKETTDWQGAVRGMFKFAKCNQLKQQKLMACFDNDVIDLLIKHNNAHDHKRINGVLRSMLA